MKRIKISRLIASLHFLIEGPATTSMKVLEDELSIYDAGGSRDVDVQVSCCETMPPDPRTLSANPSDFLRLDGGFQVSFGHTSVRWMTDETPVVATIVLPSAQSGWLSRYRNIQFSTPQENFGQMFHELVVCPTLQLFFPARFTLIHGSAIRNADDEVTIWGGTGGVGKTTIMLAHASCEEHDFMADDMSIVGDDGQVHGNLAYPKIYGYNVASHHELFNLVFDERSYIDRLAWHLKVIRNGPALVRRRVSPKQLFQNRVAQNGKLRRMFILFRCDVPALSFQEINSATAAKMNLEIMKAEYFDLYRHMNWASFNFFDQPSFRPTVDRLFKTWMVLQEQVLRDVDCRLLKIPLEMQARDLKGAIMQSPEFGF